MNAIRVLFITLLILTAVCANRTWAQMDSRLVEPAPAVGVATPGNSPDSNVYSDWAKKDVKVPNVVGLWRDKALWDLFKAGLRVGDVREETSTSVADHHVISESPAAGTQVKVGLKVDLVIARAPEVKVPDVVGLTLGAAKAALDKVDLKVGRIEERPSTTVAAGLVISESPSAGCSVFPNTPVDLLISSGVAKVAVPNVVGDSQAAATTAITAASLSLGTVTMASSATVASGDVISESPAAGTSVAAQSAVNLTVSSGPPLAAGVIFVANQNSNTVTAYSATAPGTPSQTPVGTIAGSLTGLDEPVGIALDAKGNIYVANIFSVTVYPPNPLGTLNEAPTATINVENGGVTLYGMALDASGNIYVAYPGTIEVYAANPTGTVTTPLATITGSNTHLAETHSIAFDASGRIYVTDNVYGIVVFAPNPIGTLNEAPVANIPRNSTTGLSYPWGIGIDASGNIYTVDTGHIYVFAPDPVGTVSEAPLATITGSSTQLDGGNDGLTVCPNGTIFQADRNTSVVSEFAANPGGTLNEAPFATISGAASGVNSPTAVAVGTCQGF
jgi:beta-lactam-binding protein with PASTA domain